MFSASDLNEEQVAAIQTWVSDGAQMADVQRRLKDEFGFNVTYMDTRFLALDLNLEFQVEEEDEEPAEEPTLEVDHGGQEGVSADGFDDGVAATLDQVARPGAMVSGTVTFSDGMKGLWLIDEMGRPSIDPDQPGYQPSEADLMSFQDKLRELLDGKL